MVKLGCLLVILVMLTACQPTNEDKARELILQYCDMRYKNYQPIGFETAQKYYVPFENSLQYINYIAQKQRIKRQIDSLNKLITTQTKAADIIIQKSLAAAKVANIDKNLALSKKNYKSTYRGWIILHWYNQKSNTGQTVRSNTLFIVDNNFKQVLETYEK